MSEFHSLEPQLDDIISRFQSDIGQYGSPDTYLLPDLSTKVNKDAKFVWLETGLANGMHLDDGLYRTDAEYGFYTQHGNRLTREDSHNKVFFGSLLLLPRNGDAEVHSQVAVKSRAGAETVKLTGELALFQHIGALGLKTYRPAGLVIGDEASHLMTYFEGEVNTMDVIDWQAATPEEMWSELGKAVDTMHQLHSNMLFHGDLEFRNVAFDVTGDTVIIDPELMTSGQDQFEQLLDSGIMLDEARQRLFDRLVLRMSGEFTAVCSSIDEYIIPILPKDERPRNDEARFKLYKQHLFEPYKNRVRELDEPMRGLLLRLCDQVVMRKKVQAKNQTL